MVTVQIIGTDDELDLLDGRVTYVKQAADIGEITKVNTSYSWGMKFPKTPNNTRILEGLGIAGDTSTAPYRKIYCNILDNGLPIVNKGLLKIRGTEGDEYKAYVQDGIIDFFTDISTDKISDVLDLSALDHENTVANIIASFTGNIYRYVIASYNGPPLANVGTTTNLNPFGMVPSINIEYLWDALFDYYGWTYSGDINLSGLWMTYPNAIGFSDEGNTTLLTATPKIRTYDTTNDQDTHRLQFDAITLDSEYIYNVFPGQDHTFAFYQAGNYRVKFNVEGFFWETWPPRQHNFLAIVRVNGVNVGEYSLSDEDTVVVTDIIAYSNTIVQIQIINTTGQGGTMYVTGGSLEIETLGVQTVSFSQALIKYKVADFFKEILTRQALVPFADIDNKNIEFKSLSNRLSAPYIDWSSKYVRRKKEGYVYDSYAKSNYLRHKYDEEGEDYKDGILVVENENLPIEKTIYQSKTYAPEEELQEYLDNGSSYYVNIFKMFSVEVKEDPDTGDLLADYKALKDRFFIFNAETVNRDLYILGNLVESFPLASVNGNTFDDIVQTEYADINQILNQTRVHEIELALTKWDVATLDLRKRYYFEQEKNYYLLNKLTWKSGDLCTGEFIRLS